MLPGIILITLAALVLLVATVPFLWEVLKKISPDDVKSFRFFFTFVVVFVPLFILISFGGAAVIYDATASQLSMLHSGVVSAETPPCPKLTQL
jgi:EamA domain-containing membrane protein RarD